MVWSVGRSVYVAAPVSEAHRAAVTGVIEALEALGNRIVGSMLDTLAAMQLPEGDQRDAATDADVNALLRADSVTLAAPVRSGEVVAVELAQILAKPIDDGRSLFMARSA